MAAQIKYESHLDEFLDALPEQVEQALIAIGMTAETYAKQECPVDTGRLRNSITHEVDMSEQAAIIGSNVEYAAYVELGTSRQKAQPYLRPAAENHSSEYKALAQSALKS
jgi:HK97 gp10 family phage protein